MKAQWTRLPAADSGKWTRTPSPIIKTRPALRRIPHALWFQGLGPCEDASPRIATPCWLRPIQTETSLSAPSLASAYLGTLCCTLILSNPPSLRLVLPVTRMAAVWMEPLPFPSSRWSPASLPCLQALLLGVRPTYTSLPAGLIWRAVRERRVEQSPGKRTRGEISQLHQRRRDDPGTVTLSPLCTQTPPDLPSSSRREQWQLTSWSTRLEGGGGGGGLKSPTRFWHLTQIFIIYFQSSLKQKSKTFTYLSPNYIGTWEVVNSVPISPAASPKILSVW